MATFFTEATSRSILRGVIRDATVNVPSLEEILQVFQRATSLYRNPKKIQRLVVDYASPFCLGVKWESSDPALGGVCTITAAFPQFEQVDVGWNVVVRSVTIVVTTTGAHVVTDMVPTIAFYGHALQRFFQRSGLIGWDKVREHLVCAMLLVEHVYRNPPSDLVQVQLPFVQGSFLGQMDPTGAGIIIKTYLHHRGTKPHLLEFSQLLVQVSTKHRASVMTIDERTKQLFRNDFMSQARTRFPFMFDNSTR
jgi:hypothetical protein